MTEAFFKSLPLIIPIYSGLGFLAYKKHEKFSELHKPIYIICILIMIIGLVWNGSASVLFIDFIKGSQDIEIKEAILKNHNIGLFYSFILPAFTMFYTVFMIYIFAPDEKNNIQKTQDK